MPTNLGFDANCSFFMVIGLTAELSGTPIVIEIDAYLEEPRS